MLIAITSRCKMGCKHCMVSCTPKGEDISFEDYKFAVDQIAEIDQWLIITGGEPLLHPDIIKMCDYALDKKLNVCLTSNGMNLTNDTLRSELCRLMDKMGEDGTYFNLQITHDKRYYPKPIDMKIVKQLRREFPDSFTYVDRITAMSSLGRAKKNHIKPYTRSAAMCCNVIMVANQTDNLPEMIKYLSQAVKLCHLTVLPNLDIQISECRQVNLTNMRTDPDWQNTCFKRLQLKNQDKENHVLCDLCEHGNLEIFNLVFQMQVAKAMFA